MKKKLIREVFSAIGCESLYTNKSKVGISVLETQALLGMAFGGMLRYYYYSCTLHCSPGVIFY